MKTKFKKLLMVLPLALSAISISSCGVAVTEEEGTKLLEEIKEKFKYKKGIILEVESPEDTTSEKDRIIR